MIKKIKAFFTKFWWTILIPLGAFLLSFLGKKSTPSKKEVKEVKKDVAKAEKQKDKDKEVVEEVADQLDEVVEDTQKVVDKNLKNKGDRDEKAKDFFPTL